MILFFYVDTPEFYFCGRLNVFLLLLVLQRFVFIRLPGNLAFLFFLRLYLRLIMQYLLVISGDGRATERSWESEPHLFENIEMYFQVYPISNLFH